MTKSLYTTMLSMRTRTAFPSDWRRVDGERLQRIIAELDRGRAGGAQRPPETSRIAPVT